MILNTISRLSLYVSSMAPPSSTTDALEAASVNFLLSTLKNTNELIVDWSQVAEDNGIKHAKNA